MNQDIELIALLVKTNNMALAAYELGVTPPMVSRRLAALEKRLGVRLLNRTTRALSLTPEGEIFLAEGLQILEKMQSLRHRLSGAQTPQGTLKVAASLGFGRAHIAPALSHLARDYPEINVQLHLSDKPATLIDGGFDLIVRFGEPADGGMTARLLAYNRRIVCAAPHYLDQHPSIEQPTALSQYNCIFVRQDNETMGTWNISRGDQHLTLKVRSRLMTNDGSAALAWALDGHGLMIRSLWEIAPHLRSGRLVQVLPQWHSPNAHIYLVFQAGNLMSAKLRVVIDALLAQFAKHRQRGLAIESLW